MITSEDLENQINQSPISEDEIRFVQARALVAIAGHLEELCEGFVAIEDRIHTVDTTLDDFFKYFSTHGVGLGLER